MANGHRILLVGSGGREHALAWKILQSPLCELLVVAPGNPGISALTHAAGGARLQVVPVGAENGAGLVELAQRERLDFVICGPEGPLAAGLGDRFAALGIRFFGPSAAAAEIEGSKTFAKDLMARAGVPTAAYGTFTDLAQAEAFVRKQRHPLVVKADGLCAGKGVKVTSTAAEAIAACRDMLGEGHFGAAGARVVIEERLQGREVSLMALCDGSRFVLLESAEDHKAVFDGDQGPNTGGMGAYCPSPLMTAQLTRQIADTIFAPVVKAMAESGRAFRGVLYGGLMLTPDRGPQVIEWNCRFGDPETQALLIRLDEDLLPWLLGAATGNLPTGAPRWKPGLGLCVVLAAGGYPGKVRGGDPITGLGADGQLKGPGGEVMIVHAGTRQEGDGFVTAGGRVLGATASGATLAEARQRVYAAINRISWPEMHFRNDIGLRGVT